MSKGRNVKNKHPQNKLQKLSVSPVCSMKTASINFNFAYVVSNKGYNFERKKVSQDFYISLFGLMQKISKSTWNEMAMRGKRSSQGGFEMMDYDDMNFCLSDEAIAKLEISGDTKFHIFRFGNGNRYRMIGLKAKDCSATFYVLAIDYDFSAYEHGS